MTYAERSLVHEREGARRRYHANLEEARAKSREAAARWRANNLEKSRERCRGWHAANASLVRAYKQKWSRENRERMNERAREWRAKNPESKLETQRRRRAVASGAVSTLTRAEWAGRLEEYGGMCAHCVVCPATEMDHVVPLARGGDHELENVVPACRSCNARKSDLSLLEYVSRGGAVL